MKPLKLEFSGLNSYRERQTVDFEELGRGGLFGIFGPTGSGKSTILDAVTLALYGKVDRADRNSRGIINLKERIAEVAFTFELGGISYTVQRRYERTSDDPDSARARSARLFTHADDVLADRPEAVNEGLRRIIGLTYNEFSRAVVLPQGKFSEFLSLSGADRAQMLGHILSLERFGEPLYAAARSRARQWENAENMAIAAQRELGDCGEEAVAKAKEEAASKALLLNQTDAEYAQVRKSYEEATGLKALNDRLSTARERKNALDADAASIERGKASLDLARQAAPLKGIIEAVKRLTADRSDNEQRLVTATAKLGLAQTGLKSAEEEHRIARERQEDEEPVLTAKMTKLEEALTVKDELDRLAAQVQSADGEARRLDQAVADERLALTGLEEETARIIRDVESLSEKQRMLTVDRVRRDLIQRALQALTSLEGAQSDLEESRSDLMRKGAATQKARTNALSIFGQLAAIAPSRYFFCDDGSLSERAVEIPRMHEALAGDELLAVAEREVEYAERLESEANERVSSALINDQACVLASELREGQPCPVCGSLSHPSIVEGDAEQHNRAKADLATVQQCARAVQAWSKRLQPAASDWDNCKDNEREELDKVRAKVLNVMKLRDTFLLSARQGLGDSFSEDTATADIPHARDEMTSRDKEYAAVSRLLTDARAKEGTVRRDLEAVRNRMGQLEAALKTSATEAAMLARQIGDKKAKILDLTGGEDPSDGIAAAKASIRDLRDRVRLAQATETTQRSEADKLTREVTGLQSILTRIEADFERNRDELAKGLVDAGFETQGSAEQAMLPDRDVKALEQHIQEHQRECDRVEGQIRQLEEQIAGRTFSEEEYAILTTQEQELETRTKTLRQEAAIAEESLRTISVRKKRRDELERERLAAVKQRDVALRLANMLRGKAFVKFLAEEHLRDMAADASARLGSLTGQRYALEITGGTDFVIRDDFNGGERRPVSTLSGGETFLTSLALALALSSKVQLRGQYPLGFFFLDEGFGTLDDEKLDAVIGALERLHDKDRIVGVISHVKELKERLHYYLEITASGDDGAGSKVVAKVG